MGFVDSVRQTLGNVAHFGKICPIVSVKGVKLLFLINNLLLILTGHGCLAVLTVASVQRDWPANVDLLANT